MIKTLRTHYQEIPSSNELGLEKTINNIGYENILEILPCYAGEDEYFYTIIYEEKEKRKCT